MGGASGSTTPADGRLDSSLSDSRPSLPIPAPQTPVPGEDFHPGDKGWKLVWSDEFAGDTLDRSKWAPEVSCWGGGNKEHQCYTDRERNVEVVNGVLRLKAYPEEISGPVNPQERRANPPKIVERQYSSGKVRTLGLADWTYGRFEARIKAPRGQGTWPAFWMMPTKSVYGGWAASGEIDIMETVNLGAECAECEGNAGENRSVGALHFGGSSPDNKFIAERMTLPGGPEAADQYHVYAAEWGEGKINWFVDGVKFLEANQDDWFSASDAAKGRPAAPFDQPFYLMLNLAVGGAFPESENEKRFDPASFPNEVLVDWVRVYECAPDPAKGLACMDTQES